MHETIFEAVTVGVTPRKFWLVLNIPTDEISHADEWKASRADRDLKILADLSKGELEGVRGISAAKEIMTDWFVSCRNATLVLDPAALIKMNDIEQVRYDDLDYLCANNFSVLYRLFQKEHNGKKDHQQLMMNVMDKWVIHLRGKSYSLYQAIHYVGHSRATSYYEQHFDDYVINDLKSASAAFRDVFVKTDYGSYGYNVREELEKVSDRDLLDVMRKTMRQVGRQYADEEEWIVKSSHLRIPRGSTMMVAVDPRVVALYDEWRSATPEERTNSVRWGMRDWELKRYDRLVRVLKEYRLNEFYDLRIVDATKFDGVGLKVRRRERDKKITEGEVVQFPKSVDKMKLAVASLSNFLSDPTPLTDRYEEGDVLELHGEIGTVLYAGKDNLEINFGNNDTRIIPREEPGLQPAHVRHWPKPSSAS